MNKFKVTFLSICTAAMCIVPFSGYAQDQNDAPAANYSSLESIGLLDATHKKSLGVGIYHQSSRSALTYLLKNIEDSEWISLKKIINNFLLTTADASALQNDVITQPGYDLFTLRINALIRLGLNKEAFALFSKFSGESYHENLARSGIFSMLLNQEKALACLETKTLLPHFKNKLFWQELDAYCTLSLSSGEHPKQHNIITRSKKNILKLILSSKDYRFEYDTTSFSGLTFLERALLTAENRIAFQDRDPHKYSLISPQHIAPLLLQSNLSDESRILLTMQAIKHDIVKADSLISLYEELNKRNKNLKIIPNDIAKVAELYSATKGSWLPKKRKEKIDQAFSLSEKYGDISLLPFLPIIEKMKVGDDLSLENTKRTMILFLYANKPVPSSWLKNLIKFSPENKSHEKLRSQLLFIATLLSNSSDKDQATSSQKILETYLLSNSYTAALKNIIENIDILDQNSDKVRYIYENDFDLVKNKSYTMPPAILLDELEQSSKNQNIGTTLLLSSAILGGISSKELYPGTLGKVVIALSKTGLKQMSYRILAQAVLETTN